MAKKELIYSLGPKDFRVETFAAGGPGGQHQNKTASAVRITHIESGAVGESREERSQLQNKKIAFERLLKHPKFKLWHNRKVWEYDNKKTIEQAVEEQMQPKHLRFEVRQNGKWVEVDFDLNQHADSN